MSCARCEELREENRQLKRELYARVERRQLDQLRGAYKLAPQEAWTVLAMYDKPGTPISAGDLTDGMPKLHVREHMDHKVAQIVVHRIRRKMGEGSVVNIFGSGYMLTLEGREKVAKVVG